MTKSSSSVFEITKAIKQADTAWVITVTDGVVQSYLAGHGCQECAAENIIVALLDMNISEAIDETVPQILNGFLDEVIAPENRTN